MPPSFSTSQAPITSIDAKHALTALSAIFDADWPIPPPSNSRQDCPNPKFEPTTYFPLTASPASADPWSPLSQQPTNWTPVANATTEGGNASSAPPILSPDVIQSILRAAATAAAEQATLEADRKTLLQPTQALNPAPLGPGRLQPNNAPTMFNHKAPMDYPTVDEPRQLGFNEVGPQKIAPNGLHSGGGYAGPHPISPPQQPVAFPPSLGKKTSEMAQLQQLAAIYLMKQQEGAKKAQERLTQSNKPPISPSPTFDFKLPGANPMALPGPSADVPNDKINIGNTDQRSQPNPAPSFGPNGALPAQAFTVRRNRRPETNPLLFIQPNAKYTVSLNGRFWSLNEWPTGRRDEDHNLTFGKHKLDVTPEGIIRVVLYGGVGRYTVKLHICLGDDVLGQCDEDGWTAAIMGPNCSHFELVAEAKQMGWQALRVGSQEPLIVPPHLAKMN